MLIRELLNGLFRGLVLFTICLAVYLVLDDDIGGPDSSKREVGGVFHSALIVALLLSLLNRWHPFVSARVTGPVLFVSSVYYGIVLVAVFFM